MVLDIGEYMGENFFIIYEQNVFAQRFHGYYFTKKSKKNENTNYFKTDFWKIKLYCHIDPDMDTYFHNFLFSVICRRQF